MLVVNIKEHEYAKIEKARVVDFIKNQLNRGGISYSLQTLPNGNYGFQPDKDGRIFKSKTDNKSPRKVDPTEVTKLGRDYYRTTRLRKDQFEFVINTILGTFDELDLAADVSYKGTMWRENKVNMRQNIKSPLKFAEAL